MLSILCDKRPSTYVEITFYGHFRDLSTYSKRKYRTKTVYENGINPIYTTDYSRDQFRYEKIIFPAMASVQLAVYEESGRLLGQRFLQVSSIQPGFRHVILRNAANKPMGPVTLFVLFKVRDYVDERSLPLVDALQNPIAAMKKEQAASALFVNPIETLKMRESMLLALEETEPHVVPIGGQQHGDSVDESFEASLCSCSAAPVNYDRVSLGSDSPRELSSSLGTLITRDEVHALSIKSRHASVVNAQADSERLKTRFYLEDVDLPFITLEELESSPKVLKIEKSFRKKHVGADELLEFIGNRSSSSLTNQFSGTLLNTYLKYEKERYEQLMLIAEQNRKKLLKRIDMTHRCEAKQLNKLNHQKRYEETMRMNERTLEDIADMREKYVKLGVEEQRRLNHAKESRIKEVEDKFEKLKAEAHASMETRLRRVDAALH
ncbi:hypothetical protein AB6A40_001870 [Gnathostoma spinigerum]|uniref:phosphoinositide phospholipase C n=1 Tax=Gnathostoma spinigerum TaxID=75299 RepID=A0ABD6ECR9_9BILA